MGSSEQSSEAAGTLLIRGRVYRITHRFWGEFTARVIDWQPLWAGYEVIDENQKLREADMGNGTYIELSHTFTRVTPL